MLANRAKLVTVGCLVLGLLFCLAGAVTVSWYKKSTECFKQRPALKSLVLTIDKSQQKLLIEQSRKFADKYGFRFEVVYYTPNGDDFLIDMIGKDVEVVVSNPFEPGEFEIGFYNYDCIYPTVVSDVDGLVNDLKGLLGEIPGTRISEGK